MTLPSKGSRPITIDGHVYRWTIRDSPTYSQGVGESHLTVAVESAESPVCTLHLTLPALRRDNWLLLPGYIVKPRDLARWIPKALAAGWNPRSPGPTFRLVLEENDLDTETLDRIRALF